MQKISFILILLLASIAKGYAGKYLLANESAVYSFTTTNGKKMMFAEDTGNKYLVYRFGTKDKIELEYYSKATDSQKNFRYSSYFRAVTDGIYGMDEKFIGFHIGNFHYVIYDTHFQPNGKEMAEDNAVEDKKAGILVTDTATKKKINIKANLKTIEGSISSFWDDPRFSRGHELYEDE